MGKMNEPRIVEELAALAHEQWAGWMRYLFLCSDEGPDGTFTIPRDKVDRWQRQIITKYARLTEKEKESDRREARKVLQTLYAYAHFPVAFRWLRNLPRPLHYLSIRLFGARHLPCPLCGELHRYGMRLPNGERVDVLWTQGTKGLVVSRDSEYFGHRYPLVVKERIEQSGN